MSNRISALSSILRSPARILGIVLTLVFIVEVGVMLVLPHVMPDFFGETGKAFLDAMLLTLVCAPVLWWVIIGPLRRIAFQEHQRSETIVANASEGIITFDEAGVILSCNRAVTEIFSADIENVVGKTADAFLSGLPHQFDSLPATLRLSGQRSDGTSFPVEVSVSQYPSESQVLRIAIMRDLTAAEQAETQRVAMARETEALRAQQMATLAQLATGVAHEIRNPLTAIKLLIQVNRDKFAQEGLPTDDLELVEHEIRRMERSVNSLLDFARPEEGQRVIFPIQTVISKTVQLINGRCSQQNVHINIDCTDEPLFVDGDASQIQQLLLNLSLNALDSMPTGGTLLIRVTNVNQQIELAVIDTGEGIREDMLEKMFTPFSSSKSTGVGLGLGICRRIAHSHGGDLTGQNRSGGGAEFLLTLPRVQNIQGVAKAFSVA
ncbi:MAG: PAS domain S-box protein [Pirellulaceae bacterium]|nr:PAS domain S-box protein [Pirellulaceae bacterium]